LIKQKQNVEHITLFYPKVFFLNGMRRINWLRRICLA